MKFVVIKRNKASQCIITSVVFNITISLWYMVTCSIKLALVKHDFAFHESCLNARYIGIELCHDIEKIT